MRDQYAMATDKRAETGYSRDQFYRRVKWLAKEGEITPYEGAHNKIILTDADYSLLGELRSIEDAHKADEWSLQACLQELRLQRERHEAERLKDKIIATDAHNRSLQKALKRLLGRRYLIRKVSAWWKARFSRPTEES